MLSFRPPFRAALAVLACTVTLGLIAPAAQAQAKEQYFPLLSYRVGPFAAGGTGFFGGIIDYFNLVNLRDGGVNGVKLVWDECETEYNAARGVECYERLKQRGDQTASIVEPLATPIAYGILDRVPVDKVPMTTYGYGRSDAADGRVFPWVFPIGASYWSQASAMMNYLAQTNGGAEKLKGKKIALLYLDSAFGREPIPVFEEYARRWSFDFIKIPIAAPGNEQQSQWLQVRQARPDYVVLWGFGVMNPTAIKAAARVGFPRDRMLGVWWAGSEEDVIPAGDAAIGYIAAANVPSGANVPVVQEIKKVVYGAKKGNLDDQSRIGTVYHNRGITAGMIYVEALRKAQERFGKGKVMTGDQIRWGLEQLNFDDARLKALGATGMMPNIKTSCLDHEGSGQIKFMQWDGKAWKVLTPEWVNSDRTMLRKMIEDSAARYAAEKKITLRDCSKES